MLSHLPALLQFLTTGAIWLVVLVCLLRACKRIESAAALRLLTPALWLLAAAGAWEVLSLLIDLKNAVAHRGGNGLKLPPPHSKGGPAWWEWLRFAAQTSGVLFFCPKIRKSLIAVAILGTLLFWFEHQAFLSGLVR
ncbi:hypothetical protein [Luteolibacter sp. LG18]|uniref:hypothetical protein n=1 Tax=Luteolibacter sp. LG18 TaxID=2819286 RepID=UPI002B2BC3ED|nr:hypothetical protein llg_41500 [Luteolibacter sp. LG18]